LGRHRKSLSGEKAPRFIYLSQGDLSVEDYAKKMKVIADALRDVGQPVSEATLVLNLLRCINPRFNATADFIAGQKDMTFTTTLDQLALKELRLANEVQVAAATALVASSPSTGCGSACRSSSTTSGTQQQQPRRPRKNRRQRRRRRRPAAGAPSFPSGSADLLQPMGRTGRMAGRPAGCWIARWALWFG